MGEFAALGRRDLVGDEAAILPALERTEQKARRAVALVDPFGLGDLLHQAELIVGVENGEVGLQPHRFGVTPQQPRRDRMEGAEPQSLGRGGDHPLQTLAHFERRLVGEGDGDDLAGKGPASREDMGKPGRQHPRLAGAGPGQHQDGAVDRQHRGALRRVEADEIGSLVGGLDARAFGIAHAGGI